MVGYHKDDPMNTEQKLVAGVFSGIMTRFITQPMDVIKVRAQLIKKPKKSILRIGRKILTEEGKLAFFQGHMLGQVHSILSVSSQFYVYELTTAYASEILPQNTINKSVVSLMCGAWAGCVSTTLVIPLEVIRVRQILLHDQYAGLLRGAKKVYQTGGILAFYEGLSASLLQMGPAVGISFTTFRIVQQLILRQFETEACTDKQKRTGDCSTAKGNLHKPQNLMIASSIAGSIAGFVSKTLTYPFDLAKRRLQIGSHISDTKYKIPSQVAQLAQCKKLTDCFIKAYQKEGFPGFFRGWIANVLIIICAVKSKIMKKSSMSNNAMGSRLRSDLSRYKSPYFRIRYY
ncbi:unnamed protein product [Arctia plantaginis]|uniref:Mitochondrial carrier protein n=1 Tax=Arctia plantaginis TaxID=874455 RepID=A0A8S0Z3A7_ARCPL|nr:unnamed protein product [Arctia plantaginis]